MRLDSWRDRRRPVFTVWLPVLAAALGLAAVAAFFSLIVTAALLCAVLTFAIWRLVWALKGERARARDRVGELRSNYESIIRLLTGALDLSDSLTAVQSQRIARLGAVLARQMGLRKDEVRYIEQAAILHDIGKMGIGENVLFKNGPLDEQEWEAMKRHSEHGCNILDSIEPLRGVAEILYAHHERWDGTGYPRGLRGEDIPVGSRIFAVVDTYAAMTSSRPYRKTMPHDLAVKEIIRNSLTQFDPQVVRAFIEAEKRGLLDQRDAATEPLAAARAAITTEV